jgi:hypothetical protein
LASGGCGVTAAAAATTTAMCGCPGLT